MAVIERALVEAAPPLRRADVPYIVATVVDATRGVHARPGARMLVMRDRWVAGAIDGGDIDDELVRTAWWRTDDGAARVVSCATGHDGVVRVLLERGGAPGRIDPLVVYERSVATQSRWAIATVIGGPPGAAPIGARVLVDPHGDPTFDPGIADHLRDAIVADARAARVAGATGVRTYDGGAEVVIEAAIPPPRLFVFGARRDALVAIQRARAAGWHTTLCAPQLSASAGAQFALADEIARVRPDEIGAKIDASDRAIALVMSHCDDADRDALAMLLDSLAAYIGVIGSWERTRALLDAIGLADACGDPRLRAAATPLAVLTEIQNALQPREEHAP